MDNRKSRGFCFTINNYTDKQIDQLLDMHADYIVFGFEVGAKGTPHVQGYVHFATQRYASPVRRLITGAHWEHANGTPEQNAAYCKKDGDWYEFGELPSQGRAKWDKIEEAMANPKDNILLYNQYRKVYKDVIAMDRKDHDRKVIAIPTSEKYSVAKHCTDTIFMDDDIECYEGQEIMFLKYYNSFKMLDWYNGFPPCVRRGYEIIKIDPSVVYILCDNGSEFASLDKKYSGIDIEYYAKLKEEFLEEEISIIEDNETSES